MDELTLVVDGETFTLLAGGEELVIEVEVGIPGPPGPVQQTGSTNWLDTEW